MRLDRVPTLRMFRSIRFVLALPRSQCHRPPQSFYRRVVSRLSRLSSAQCAKAMRNALLDVGCGGLFLRSSVNAATRVLARFRSTPLASLGSTECRPSAVIHTIPLPYLVAPPAQFHGWSFVVPRYLDTAYGPNPTAASLCRSMLPAAFPELG